MFFQKNCVTNHFDFISFFLALYFPPCLFSSWQPLCPFKEGIRDYWFSSQSISLFDNNKKKIPTKTEQIISRQYPATCEKKYQIDFELKLKVHQMRHNKFDFSHLQLIFLFSCYSPTKLCINRYHGSPQLAKQAYADSSDFVWVLWNIKYLTLSRDRFSLVKESYFTLFRHEISEKRSELYTWNFHAPVFSSFFRACDRH